MYVLLCAPVKVVGVPVMISALAAMDIDTINGVRTLVNHSKAGSSLKQMKQRNAESVMRNAKDLALARCCSCQLFTVD